MKYEFLNYECINVYWPKVIFMSINQVSYFFFVNLIIPNVSGYQHYQDKTLT